jgi:hypothetical protein
VYQSKSRQSINILLLVAILITLITLLLGFVGEWSPLKALMRSGIVFTTFAILGWAASVTLVIPESEPISEMSEGLDTKEDESIPENRTKVGPSSMADLNKNS